MGKSLQADGAILSRMDLSTAVRARPDLKVHGESADDYRNTIQPYTQTRGENTSYVAI